MDKPSSKTVQSPVKQHAAKATTQQATEPGPAPQQENVQVYEVPEMETVQQYEVPGELVEYDEVERTPNEEDDGCNAELYENVPYH